jgi:hypothetical protein
MRICPDSDDFKDLRNQVKITFCLLKLASAAFKELEGLCTLLFRTCLVPEGQEAYQMAMDVAIGDRPVPATQQTSFGGPGSTVQPGWFESLDSLFPYFKYLLGTDDEEVVLDLFQGLKPPDRYDPTLAVPPELWIPLSAFPVWTVPTKNKMAISFEPPPDKALEPEFRELVKGFLSKYAPAKILKPSSWAATKVGRQKYNDGGELREDCQRPISSWTSGFLFQEFITKPLVPREVWVPGKSIKNNNTWWSVIMDSVMRRIPYSALTKEVDEIWEQIKPFICRRVERNGVLKVIGLKLLYFDMSAYGLQYPRNYLSIIAEEVCELYGNDELVTEMLRIFKYILENVNVELPDGKFVFPPRGIGLGYYENMKTLGIMAIIDSARPISCFGDQALLPFGRPALAAVEELKRFGFIFTKEEKISSVTDHYKWCGHHMSGTTLVEPRSMWTDMFGALRKPFHWERKAGLQGLKIPEEHKHVWKYLTFHYEKIYGCEFYRGESQEHFSAGGINPYAEQTTGPRKEWKVMNLPTPRIRYINDVFRSAPFASPETRMGEAKAFSKLRAETYKRSRPFDVDFIRYTYPVIEYNKSRRPLLNEYARSMPAWADLRLLVNEGTTTGRIVCGLNAEAALNATWRQCFARDPWEARASGGYRILTKNRVTCGASAEDEYVANFVINAHDPTDSLLWRKDHQFLPEHLKDAKANRRDGEDLSDFGKTQVLFAPEGVIPAARLAIFRRIVEEDIADIDEAIHPAPDEVGGEEFPVLDLEGVEAVEDYDQGSSAASDDESTGLEEIQVLDDLEDYLGKESLLFDDCVEEVSYDEDIYSWEASSKKIGMWNL